MTDESQTKPTKVYKADEAKLIINGEEYKVDSLEFTQETADDLMKDLAASNSTPTTVTIPIDPESTASTLGFDNNQGPMYKKPLNRAQRRALAKLIPRKLRRR